MDAISLQGVWLTFPTQVVASVAVETPTVGGGGGLFRDSRLRGNGRYIPYSLDTEERVKEAVRKALGEEERKPTPLTLPAPVVVNRVVLAILGGLPELEALRGHGEAMAAATEEAMRYSPSVLTGYLGANPAFAWDEEEDIALLLCLS